MTTEMATALIEHLDKGARQEDLCFCAWRPSVGRQRTTAIITRVLMPERRERILQGNVLFTQDYLSRALRWLNPGEGLSLIHSHPAYGWQDMSSDDIVAERDRVAGAAFGRTGMPLLGLTSARDGHFSARLWTRIAPNKFERAWIPDVRVVGRHIRRTWHPNVALSARETVMQERTLSVWGSARQRDIVLSRIGIVGLGSVGSIVLESLARIGCTKITLIDFDVVKERNLDRTLGATRWDAQFAIPKVALGARAARAATTADTLDIDVCADSILSEAGLRAALDCDVLFSCVDRPFARHMLNALAYAHLIPVIDGGIVARIQDGRPLHVDWRVHTVGPQHACLVCIDAVRRGDIDLDRAGLLQDPHYIEGLDPEARARFSGENVFPFSLSVAAHEVLHMVRLLTGLDRIGGVGPQIYHCYPGRMDVVRSSSCATGCPYDALTATAADLSGNYVEYEKD